MKGITGRVIIDTNDYNACFNLSSAVRTEFCKPIMPGYLFVEASEYPQRILPRYDKTRCKVLSVISEEEIMAINPYVAMQAPTVKVGDRVLVAVGLFEGVVGTVAEVTGDVCKLIPVNMRGKLEIEAICLQPA